MSRLKITRGDTEPLLVDLLDDDGQPLDVSNGGRLRFTLKRSEHDVDEDAVLVKTTSGDDMPGGITIEGVGLASIAIPADETALLVPRAAYLWDVQLTDGAGTTRTIARGTLSVAPDISRTVP